MAPFSWRSPRSGRRLRAAPQRPRPHLEHLEVRALLSSAFTTATALPVSFVAGQAQETGTIANPTDRVMYRVDAPASPVSLTARLDPSSNLFDGTVRLFGSSGNSITDVNAVTRGSLIVSNTTGDVVQFELTPSLPASLFPLYVAVSGENNLAYDPTSAAAPPLPGPGSTGSFQLDLTETPISVPNSTPATADSVALSPHQPTTLIDLFPNAGAVQHYAVNVTAADLGSQGGLLSVHLASTFSSFLRIYDPNGVEIAHNDDLANLGPRQQVYLQAPGIYDLEVSQSPGSAFTPGPKNAFRLNVVVVPVSGQPGGETIDTALPLAVLPDVSTTVSGGIEAANDVRLYHLTGLTAGTQVFLDVAAQTEGRLTISGNAFVPSQLHPYLRVLDAGGNTIPTTPVPVLDSGSEVAASFLAPASGDCWVDISSAGNETYDPTQPFSGTGSPDSTGAFNLTVRLQPPIPADVPLLPLAGTQTSSVSAGQTTSYALVLDQAGLLTLTAAPAPGSEVVPVVTLQSASKAPLIQAAAVPGSPSATLSQHLDAGVYYLAVGGSADGPAGACTLSTQFTPASEPGQAAGFDEYGTLIGDFNNDGIPDVLTVNRIGEIEVLPGLADGTFGPPVLTLLGADAQTSAQIPVSGFVSGHFSSSANLDLAVISQKTLLVYSGKGDGSFSAPTTVALNQPISGVVTVPLQGLDGLVAITTTPGKNNLIVFPTLGGAAVPHSVPGQPLAIVAGTFDLADDGNIDLAVLSSKQGQAILTVFGGDGTGRFTLASTLTLPLSSVSTLSIAGEDQQGYPDLMASDSSGTTTVLLGDGHSGFSIAPAGVGLPTAAASPQFAAGDLAGSGTDLVTGDLRVDGVVSVLAGNSDGSFGVPNPITPATQIDSVGITPFASGGPADVVVTGDALLDPTTGVLPSGAAFATDIPFRVNEVFPVGDLSTIVLRGRGDGTFQGSTDPIAALPPGSVASADFNRDGIPDLVASGIAGAPGSGDQPLSILLGLGDGTFAPPRVISVGAPSFGGVITADLNHDGLPDLAVLGPAPNSSGPVIPEVRVLLGKGDGTFAPPEVFDLPADDTGGAVSGSLTAADLSGDGFHDLLVVNTNTNHLDILRNNRDGTFTADANPLSLPPAPVAIVTGSFFNDPGTTDVAVLCRGNGSGIVAIFRNDGSGALRLAGTVGVGPSPTALTVGDFGGGSGSDLAVTDDQANTVTVVLNDGQGHFHAMQPVAAGLAPEAIVSGEFDSDHTTDLAVANLGSGDVTILKGLGQGQFQVIPQHISFGPLDAFQTLTAADFNGDGHTDLALGQGSFGQLQILLGQGNDQFVKAADVAANEVGVAPILADLDGGHVPDAVSVNQQGALLFRKGHASFDGQLSFDPPITLNDPATDPVQDVALVQDGVTLRLAALDKAGNITFYTLDSQDQPHTTAGPVVGTGASHLAAADLTGDGQGDLVVTNGSTGIVSIFLSTSSGSFEPAITRSVGRGPSDIAFAPGGDVLITNQLSGDVTVLKSVSDGYSQGSLFRAGTGPNGLEVDSAGNSAVTSFDAPAGIAVGAFAGPDLPPGAVVADSGANQLLYLQGDGHGNFSIPQGFTPLKTGSHPTGVVAGTFDLRQDGHLDVAVLDQAAGTVSIFLGNGDGTFSATPIVLQVGSGATALAVANLNGDPYPDLLVTDRQGDVLRLLGNGDGTFSEPPADPHMALAMAAPGRFVFANASGNDVAVTDASGQPVPLQEGDGLQDPGAVRILDLGTDAQGHDHQALIVANSGGNDILVYQGMDGQFDRASEQVYPVGTNPVGLTVADINSDGTPDVIVANEGSNDVSLLVGRFDGTTYTLDAGPRLPAGRGPVSTAFIPGDAATGTLPSLAIANSLDNDVFVLPGRGQGFFDSQNPHMIATGTDPREVVAGHFDSQGGMDLLTVNAGSNDLTFISAVLTATAGREIGVGEAPVAIAAFGDGAGSGFLVANEGSGSVSVLLDGADGPALAVTEPAGVPNPSDLILMGVGNGKVDYLVAPATQEVVLPRTVDFSPVPVLVFSSEPTAVPEPTLSGALQPVGTGPGSAAVVQLDPRDILSRDPPAATDSSRTAPLAGDSPTAAPRVNVSLLPISSEPAARPETGGDEVAQLPLREPEPDWLDPDPSDDLEAPVGPAPLAPDDVPQRPQLPVLEEVCVATRTEPPAVAPASATSPADDHRAALVLWESLADREGLDLLAPSLPEHPIAATWEEAVPTSAQMYSPLALLLPLLPPFPPSCREEELPGADSEDHARGKSGRRMCR
jgi:hypothetical protein